MTVDLLIKSENSIDDILRTNVETTWIPWLQLYVQKVLCSEGPMFRRFYVQKVLCSEGSMFRRFYVQKVLYSEGSMFRRSYVQKYLFRRSYVQKVRVTISL